MQTQKLSLVYISHLDEEVEIQHLALSYPTIPRQSAGIHGSGGVLEWARVTKISGGKLDLLLHIYFRSVKRNIVTAAWLHPTPVFQTGGELGNRGQRGITEAQARGGWEGCAPMGRRDGRG